MYVNQYRFIGTVVCRDNKKAQISCRDSRQNVPNFDSRPTFKLSKRLEGALPQLSVGTEVCLTFEVKGMNSKTYGYYNKLVVMRLAVKNGGSWNEL